MPDIGFVLIFLIPIVAIIAAAYRHVREREYLYKERLLAAEKGLSTVPEASADVRELHRELRRGGRGPAFHGVVWTAIGLGVMLYAYLALNVMQDSDMEKFATFILFWAIPAFLVGVGLLIYAYFTRNGQSRGRNGSGGSGPSADRGCGS